MPRILIVEDEANMARSLSRILERRGYGIGLAAEGGEALEKLDSEPFDLVITDLKMPGMGGMELLAKMHERGHRHGTIVLTGYGSVQGAVEAMKLGAADYLIKPYNPEELLLIVERQLEQRALRRENERLRQQVRRERRFGEIVGASAAMEELYRVVDAVAQNRSNVLLIGESGAGKELVARTIHERSPLAERPFLAVNCAGMSDTLIDSQLFGHKRGAFTGAIGDHEGVFQAAGGGTLFLDEVYEIPLSLQPKFLRAIQEREVTPIGSNKPIAIDVRIVAATHRDLEREVKNGTFRADLYYRLNVVTLRLPALRERKEDIPLLVDHFVREFAALYRVEPKQVTEAAAAALERYDWPGNVRELQNTIERAFALSRDVTIDVGDLPPAVRREASSTADGDGLDFDPEVPSLAHLEEKAIRAALDRSQGNKNQAARMLGIDRQRLYRKISKYGIR